MRRFFTLSNKTVTRKGAWVYAALEPIFILLLIGMPLTVFLRWSNGNLFYNGMAVAVAGLAMYGRDIREQVYNGKITRDSKGTIKMSDEGAEAALMAMEAEKAGFSSVVFSSVSLPEHLLQIVTNRLTWPVAAFRFLGEIIAAMFILPLCIWGISAAFPVLEDLFKGGDPAVFGLEYWAGILGVLVMAFARYYILAGGSHRPVLAAGAPATLYAATSLVAPGITGIWSVDFALIFSRNLVVNGNLFDFTGAAATLGVVAFTTLSHVVALGLVVLLKFIEPKLEDESSTGNDKAPYSAVGTRMGDISV